MKIIYAITFLLSSLNVTAEPLSLHFIDSYTIPTGKQFNGSEFGGISGIDHIKGNRYYAISDNRGGAKGHPVFFELRIDYDAQGLQNVSIEKQTFLKQPNGTRFPAQPTVDPESIRLAPNGNLYWSSEGNFSQQADKRHQPFIHEINKDGQYVRAFKHPTRYNYTDKQTHGGRDNKLFEALAVDEKGIVYVGNEDALIQDGHVATDFNNSALRITAFNPTSGEAIKQYAYILPAIPNHGGLTIFQVNGLTELLSIGNNRFLALERAFIAGTGNYIRIVETQITSDTTDVSQRDSLIGTDYTPMTRKVILDIPPHYQGLDIDNIEGITWGKRLENGNRTLLLVSDNNFSNRQVTQFLLFEVNNH